MSPVFVDTSAWVALSDRTDSGHIRARELYSTIGKDSRLVTSNYVLSESYTWIRYKASHREAMAFHDRIQAAVRVGMAEIAWVSPEVHEAAYGLFQRFPDQVLSFTDCASAVIARERRVDFVFSFDRDFVILGFDVRPGR